MYGIYPIQAVCNLEQHTGKAHKKYDVIFLPENRC